MDRRNLLAIGAMVPAAVAVPDLGAPPALAGASCAPALGPVRIDGADPRYEDLVARGNIRFAGRPDEVYLVGSPEQVVPVVQDAVRAGRRLAVRSGGHCFENFTDDPAVRVVLDTSTMTGVYHDPRFDAFAVEAGATMGQVYRQLFLGWGVTIPAGWHPVAAGGHVLGGGYGYLSRQHGLAVDHLYAVEVVVVDRGGTARRVIATREPDDPHRDLWWAHTGGGGGNFGVVTRYWFRTPGAPRHDPSRLLPAPPASVLSFTASWPWDVLDRPTFGRLVDAYGRWFERNSGPDSPYNGLYSELYLYRNTEGRIDLIGQVIGPDAERQLEEFIAALSAAAGPPSEQFPMWTPWLASALAGAGQDGKQWRTKVKGAFARRRLTERQVDVAYRYLTRTDREVSFGALGLNGYGGKINGVAPTATAVAQRDSVMVLFFATTWDTPEGDAQHLRWIREFYRDTFADTGGVPVPGGVVDGTYINYPDTDLADSRWNRSGAPWSRLYYKHNYQNLQRAKSRWDPRDVFRHRLSVRPG